jgi:hypothetical protein
MPDIFCRTLQLLGGSHPLYPGRQSGFPKAFQRLGWVERSETHHAVAQFDDGLRKGSSHPTTYDLRLIRSSVLLPPLRLL